MESVIDFLFCYKDQETLTLSDEQFDILTAWISENLRKQKSTNRKISSYGLKHIAEKRVGFYVSNADMKKAMVRCGFEPRNTREINWFFNVAYWSIDKVTKPEKPYHRARL